MRVPDPEAAETTLTTRIKRVAMAGSVGQVLVQSTTLLQTVVLARLLTPAEVGVFVAGTVLTAFMANFAEGGMRAALVHRGDRDLDDAIATVFRGTLITGTALSLAALVAAPLVGVVFGSPTAAMIAAVCSGSLLLYALTNVPEALLQRQFSAARRLVVGPAITISFAASSVALAALGFGVWSLVVGTYVSHLVWVVTVWCLTDWRPGRGRASWQQWRTLAGFGMPLVIGFLGSRLQQMIEAVVVGRGLSTTALGFYRYGTRIARVPVDATVDIVASALFPAFSRVADDPDRLRNSYLQALCSVTVFAAAVSGLLFAVGESAVVVLLGEPWRGAGVAVVAMAGLGLGNAVTSVCEEAIKGSGRTRLINRLTLAEFGLGVGLLVLIIPFGLIGVGLAISLTALGAAAVGLSLVRSIVDVSLGEMSRAILPQILSAAVAMIVTWMIEDNLRSDTYGMAAGIGLILVDVVAFGIVYLAILHVVAPSVTKGLWRLLRHRPHADVD
ncbi:oligosaccharide flippase family protein [Pseudonocardia sp. GCM10023141]|uniref:oligosaccharide flippase family protein n=1 Tax=Pseudonocardia sp. GCM10023141 TaxID=3252653 RepID=UPI0036235C15